MFSLRASPRRRSLSSLTVAAFALGGVSCLAAAAAEPPPTPALGHPVSEAELRAVDLIIAPDGSGLPPGAGTAAQGRPLYRQKCQACHGALGEGTSALTRLAGGELRGAGSPVRTIGSYWPYATTLFDFVRRAMPADAPKSLSDLEVYQLTAYLLHINGIIAEDTEINAATLPAIVMPNAGGFTDRSAVQ